MIGDYQKPKITYKSSNHIHQTSIRMFDKGEQKMAKLKEEANQYVPPTTKNISDLDEVSVNMDVQEKEVQKDNGETFKYKYVTVGEDEYRVGASVLKQLKTHLEENPDLKTFKVKRKGEGIKTVYTVIPLK